ncbi:MAG: antibiotic biosynthesis monooxygenase [Bacteroidota bacterium]|nr:antibiotic biosynthesis monooxygenase [Bacteroidota bacterium]
MEKEGASIVITHQIIDGKQSEYENWLDEIGPLCRNATGHLDWQIIRPIPTLTSTYTIIIRFDSIEHLKGWINSNERHRLIEKVGPLLDQGDNYFIRSGLDFLFTPLETNTKVPARWKQYLTTWSAIFPLSAFIPLIILPILRKLGIPSYHLIDSLFISGTIVLLMVYFVMPYYTKLIKKWLYK